MQINLFESFLISCHSETGTTCSTDLAPHDLIIQEPILVRNFTTQDHLLEIIRAGRLCGSLAPLGPHLPASLTLSLSLQLSTPTHTHTSANYFFTIISYPHVLMQKLKTENGSSTFNSFNIKQ